MKRYLVSFNLETSVQFADPQALADAVKGWVAAAVFNDANMKGVSQVRDMAVSEGEELETDADDELSPRDRRKLNERVNMEDARGVDHRDLVEGTVRVDDPHYQSVDPHLEAVEDTEDRDPRDVEVVDGEVDERDAPPAE